MSALQGAVNAGARNIFVDRARWSGSATQALKFGATHVYPDIDSALAGIAEVTAGLMAKKVIVTVGELARRGHRQLPQPHRPRAAPAW